MTDLVPSAKSYEFWDALTGYLNAQARLTLARAVAQERLNDPCEAGGSDD